MIYKWNELDYEHFLEFLLGFYNGEDYAKDKVLEVRCLGAIAIDFNYRVFFSRSICIQDYEKYNKMSLGIVKIFEGLMPELRQILLGRGVFSFCSFDKDGPHILPIDSRNSLNSILNAKFGDSQENTLKELDSIQIGDQFSSSRIPLWYENIDGNKIAHVGKVDKIPDNKSRLVRFRTMDFSTWKDIIKDWECGRGLGQLEEDDLDKDKVGLLNSEISDIINKTIKEQYYGK